MQKPKREPMIKTFRSLSNYTKDIFCYYLLCQVPTLNTIMGTDDVSKQVDILTEVFNESLDSCAPIVTKKITRPPAPWMTQEILEEMQKRDELRNLRDINFSEQSIENYKLSKNHVNQMVNTAKRGHFNKKLIENKGNVWDVLREIVPSKQKDKRDCSFENIEETANNFNEYFANVGRNVYAETQEYREDRVNERDHEPRDAHENANFYRPRNQFRPQPVYFDEVASTIANMKNKNSHGSDGMTTRFLKDSLTVLTFYITMIVNTSIVTGVVPRQWKNAIVCPLYKQGNTLEPSNFRPVSLLPVLSKVLEKIVANQLYSYMEENNRFSNSQHGFRKKLSTETALNIIMEEVFKNLDSNEISLLTLCDLSKAFDSVSHELLIEKLDTLHIDEFWFKNYLSERTQSVKIEGHISDKKGISYGVPQGSILGPLLFNIYVNDLQSKLDSCPLVQYADDSQFLISGKTSEIIDIVDACENKSNVLMDYFANNGLKLNADKTNFLFIGSRQNIS